MEPMQERGHRLFFACRFGSKGFLTHDVYGLLRISYMTF